MQVKLYATLRQKSGGKYVDLDTPPETTIQHILTTLTTRFPALEPDIWDGHHTLARHVHVFVNGRDVTYLQGLDTLVTLADSVDIFPPVAGG